MIRLFLLMQIGSFCVLRRIIMEIFNPVTGIVTDRSIEGTVNKIEELFHML